MSNILISIPPLATAQIIINEFCCGKFVREQDFFAETLNLCVEKVEISEFYLENDCFVCEE